MSPPPCQFDPDDRPCKEQRNRSETTMFSTLAQPHADDDDRSKESSDARSTRWRTNRRGPLAVRTQSRGAVDHARSDRRPTCRTPPVGVALSWGQCPERADRVWVVRSLHPRLRERSPRVLRTPKLRLRCDPLGRVARHRRSRADPSPRESNTTIASFEPMDLLQRSSRWQQREWRA